MSTALCKPLYFAIRRIPCSSDFIAIFRMYMRCYQLYMGYILGLCELIFTYTNSNITFAIRLFSYFFVTFDQSCFYANSFLCNKKRDFLVIL